MEESSVQTLSSLPIDILCNVFRQLDPIGLIATSQTCCAFRDVIAPSKRHFAERLLALELEEAYGGVVPQFLARNNQLTPPWEDNLWQEMRWACTHCLRLLRHESFDNRSLLRLRYRKPQPGSTGATLQSGVTSWEPVRHTGFTAGQERRRRMAHEDVQALKAEYHSAVTKNITSCEPRTRINNLEQLGLDSAAVPPHVAIDDLANAPGLQVLDLAARMIENVRTGSHRLMRQCNECRFQQGYFKQISFITSRFQQPGHRDQLTWGFNCNKGTEGVPIICSRRIFYETFLDRHFPDLTKYAKCERPEYQLLAMRIHRRGHRYYPATTYMARCPVCSTWQELRNFRREPQGWGFGEYIGIGSWMSEEDVASYLNRTDQMCCNRCVAEKSGEQALAQELLAIFHIHMNYVADECLGFLQTNLGNLDKSTRLPKDLRNKLKQLVQSMATLSNKWKMHNPRGYPQYDLDADNFDDNLKALKGKHDEWMHLSKSMPEFVKENLSNGSWISEYFTIWHNEWDGVYKYWQWLAALRMEVRAKPEILVAWAFDQPVHRPQMVYMTAAADQETSKSKMAQAMTAK